MSEWPGWVRGSAYTAVVVVLVLLAALVGGVVAVRRPLPQVDGTLKLDGLSDTVQVMRDDRGVPQIYAGNSADLFYAQGYVQAQDRFFEMDFRRHVTAGRISELLGEKTVETDMLIRTMGWRRVAAQEYDLLAPSTRAYLDAYSDGVNAYLAGRSATRLSAEYTVLGLGGLDYTPEKWTPVDSLAWLKAMAWDLGGNMEEEVARTRLSLGRTPEQVDELYPRYPYDRHAPIVATPAGSQRGASPRPAIGPAAANALEAVRRGVDAIPDLLGRGSGIGSNSWVVSGEHTVSGKPLLANDPHLQTSIPGIWYPMGLHCRTVNDDCPFDVSGFTFSGLPGVVIGHNRDIAWGMTNLDPDVMDLYLEKVSGKTYLRDGQQVPLTERDEVIRIAGHSSKLFTVRSTRHGPLLSDVSAELSSVGANAQVPTDAPDRENGYAVSLAWTALTPRPTADALFGFDTASSWTEFREAARQFAVPSQNLVYADTAGNIGYQAPGAVPVRKGDRDGNYPAAGWLSKNDWTGRYVPFDQLPSVLNPAEGFIVTANQAVTGPDYRWYLSDSPDQGYRSQRIRNLITTAIDEGRRLDVSDLTKMQGDTRNPMAPVLVPYLMRQLMTSEYDADGQRLLLDWDFTQPADSAAAAYFNVVWSNVLRLTFHDQLPESLWPDGGERWIAVVGNLLRQPSNQWWDDAGTESVVEDRDQILAEAMRQARDELTRKMNVSPKKWTWGHLHRLDLENQSLGQTGIGVVDAIFNRGPYDVGGGSASVDATNWNAVDGYAVTSAPSMRMVVDLDDLDRSRWINLTGASGHIASGHYRDQTSLWVDGRTLPWVFGKSAVEKATQHRLVLEPTEP
jgi:penicillin G amidase